MGKNRADISYPDGDCFDVATHPWMENRNAQVMDTWPQFYHDRLNDGYLQYVKKQYAEHINAVMCNIRVGDHVHEIGCGTGTISRIIADRSSHMKNSFVLSDINPEMLAMAHQRMTGAKVEWGCLPYAAQEPPYPCQVVHSHGVLEHFDDETIRTIIKAHSKARVQVHYVPGPYDHPSFGDERLMPAWRWKEICNPDMIVEFNNGLDYCLVFNEQR